MENQKAVEPAEEDELGHDVYNIARESEPMGHKEATRIALYACIAYRVLCAVHEKYSTKNPEK